MVTSLCMRKECAHACEKERIGEFGVTDNAGFWLLVTSLKEGREALSLT